MDLQEFTAELTENIFLTASEENRSAEDLFTEEALDYLRLSGDVVEPVLSPYRAKGIRVDAFDFDDETMTLDLFITDFSATPDKGKISNTEVQDALKRVYAFWTAADKGKTNPAEGDSVHELNSLIRQQDHKIQQVRLFLLTNRISSAESLPAYHASEGPIFTCELWDVERLYQQYRINAGKQTIEVDLLRDYDFRLECLRAGEISGQYVAYLAVLPASILARIYKRYKQSLLERNVRTFLQFKVDTNQGIKETASKAPDMFFAYNNGISTTAALVETLEEDGKLYITRIEDWQIVNGGQTTASLYTASAEKGIDLTKVFVQLKICEITAAGEADTIIPNISKFANKQTAIKSSDFSSNSVYHVNLEKMSRAESVPSFSGLKSDVKWYYERTRGQYLDEEARQDGLAARRKFSRTYPKTQRFSKVDVAKYEMSWLQKPHEVSLGAEKNYLIFEKLVAVSEGTMTSADYHRLIARAILFKQIDKEVLAKKLGGYKANVVTYVLAWLAHKTEGNLDLNRIWLEQSVSEHIRILINQMIDVIWPHLTNPPESVRNVSEWCKKPDCWKTLKDKYVDLAVVQTEIDEVKQRVTAGRPEGQLKKSPAEQALLTEVKAIAPEVFTGIHSWAVVNNQLTPMDRRLMLNVGALLRSSKEISIKQAREARRIFEAAKSKGFVD